MSFSQTTIHFDLFSMPFCSTHFLQLTIQTFWKPLTCQAQTIFCSNKNVIRITVSYYWLSSSAEKQQRLGLKYISGMLFDAIEKIALNKSHLRSTVLRSAESKNIKNSQHFLRIY